VEKFAAKTLEDTGNVKAGQGCVPRRSSGDVNGG